VIVIHLARKPLSESSVAANVLKHGTGAISIDPCRIGTGADKGIWPVTGRVGRTAFNSAEDGSLNNPVETDITLGRWPANLLLQHRPGCRRVGTKRVKGSPRTYVRSVASGNANAYSKGVGEPAGAVSKNYATPDGTETTPSWECESGCPIAALDADTTWQHIRGNRKPTTSGGPFFDGGWEPVVKGHHLRPELEAEGGASRFFKQVGGTGE
jgi:hypothetical protein